MTTQNSQTRLPPIVLGLIAASTMNWLHKTPTQGVAFGELYTKVIPSGLMTREEFSDFIQHGVQAGALILDENNVVHDAHNWSQTVQGQKVGTRTGTRAAG